MNKLLFLFGLSLLCVACNKTDSKETNETGNSTSIEEAGQPLPPLFYLKLAGKIGDNILISMDLTRKDTALFGHYVYLSKNQPLELSGTIDKAGNVKLSEFVPAPGPEGDVKETGKFVGKIDSKGFKGTWSGGGKSFPFELTEKKDKNYAQLSYESYHNFYQAKGDEGNGTAEIGYDFFQIKEYGNEAVKTAINQTIMNRVLAGSFNEGNKKAPSVDKMMEDFIANFRKDAKEQHKENPDGMELSYSDDYEMGVEYHEHDLLCLSAYFSVYLAGAHPNSGIEYFNFDLKTGKNVTLADVLIPNYKTKLLPIAEKLFRIQNGIGNQSFEEAGYFQMGDSNGKFVLAEEVSFQPDGLLFTYQQYEIAAYALGMSTVKVPYSVIKELIKKESALGWAL